MTSSKPNLARLRELVRAGLLQDLPALLDYVERLEAAFRGIARDSVETRQGKEGKPVTRHYSIGFHDACEHFWRLARAALQNEDPSPKKPHPTDDYENPGPGTVTCGSLLGLKRQDPSG